MINLDFKKAPQQNIDFLKSKGLSLSFDYKDLQKEAHQKAFTVAKIMNLDVVSDIQSSLIKAMNEGQSFKKWKNELIPLLQQKGWYGKKDVVNPQTGEVKTTYIGSRRLRTIFETNMRTSYAQGRANNIYGSSNEYIIYSAILDSRTRIDHRALNGIVKHRNDTFWQKHFPPNGWNCRCYVKSISKKELEKRGLKVDTNEYNLVDSDFAYDLRNLSQVSLQNSYFNKVQDVLKNCIETNARKVPCPFSDIVKKNYRQDIIKTLPTKEDFSKFIDETLDKNIKSNKASITGYLTLVPGVIDFLSKKNITPQSDVILANTANIRNLKAKEEGSKKGKVLTNEEIKALVEKFKDPDAVYWDGDLLIVFDSFDDDKINKVIIKIDFQSKKEIYNNIHSGTKYEILSDLESYEIIYKKK